MKETRKTPQAAGWNFFRSCRHSTWRQRGLPPQGLTAWQLPDGAPRDVHPSSRPKIAAFDLMAVGSPM